MSDRPILTATQQAVHSCILSYYDRNGVTPSTVEIRAITGYSDREIIRARNELLVLFSADRMISHHPNCPSCDGELQPVWNFCPNCSLPLRAAA